MIKKPRDLILTFPPPPNFQPLAEKAIDKLGEEPGNMLQDAFVESIAPEPISILLEISGTIEQIQQARSVLNAMNLQITIIQQHEKDDERDDI